MELLHFTELNGMFFNKLKKLYFYIIECQIIKP